MPDPSAPLPNSLLIPHTPATRRLLSRLSKDTLLDLILHTWLDAAKATVYNPALTSPDPDGDGSSDTEELTLDAARTAYEALRRKAAKTKDVLARVLEREWRAGLSLLQLAELDYHWTADLLTRPGAHRWASATLHALNRAPRTGPPPTPRFHAAAFARALQGALRPLVATHTFAARHPALPLVLLRVHMCPAAAAPSGAGRVLWLAFPTAAPACVFHSVAGAGAGLGDAVREGVAAAASREHARFEVRAGGVAARTLEAMCFYRGGGGGAGGMVGVWRVYAEGVVEAGPLDVMAVGAGAKRGGEQGGQEEGEEAKRRRVAEGRFGGEARAGDGRGLECVEFTVMDRFPDMPPRGGGQDDDDEEEEEFRPCVGLKLEGAHVFAGVRSLVEDGRVFDGVRMPGWIAGEGGVSVGTVKDGVLIKRGG